MTAPPSHRLAPRFLLLLAIAAACVAVNSQSFWIDETQTALKAIPPTLHGWWQALYGEHNSNLQLPLYMITVWGWARIFGVSELSIRAVNIPFFLLGFFAILRSVRRHPGFRNTLLLVYCLHPFVWYYLNEARPYLVQMSGALLVSGAIFSAYESEDEPLSRAWWWQFAAGMVILCGSGILGVPWGAAAILLLLPRRGFLRSSFGPGLPGLLVSVPTLLIIGIYYAWTLKIGARPGETGMRASSIPFALYEHFGFVGMGPGRAEMRSGELGVFLRWLPSLGLLGIPLIYALARASAVRFGIVRPGLAALCAAIFIPAAFVFTLGFAKGFLVLGRHITPLFPYVLGATAFSVNFLWSRGRVLDRVIAGWLIAALAASAFECRFALRHQRDDNRGAVAVAKAALARGEYVWWIADGETARYYGLRCSMQVEPGAVLLFWKKTPAELAADKPPALIVLCKPDLFDPYSGVREFIAKNGYVQTDSLPAFSFWEKR